MHEQDPTKKRRVPNNLLKKERERRGLTQRDVANLIGLPDTHTVGRWERGISLPHPHYRQALCRIFEKGPEELGFLKQTSEESIHQPLFSESNQRIALIWNMPSSFTSFIGREQEIAAVCAMLERTNVRLVTLLGAGGVGKTRLGVQVATEMQERFVDGGCFVSLAAISDHSLVIPTIAEVLGVQEDRAQPIIEVVKYALRNKHFLLFLDNFEHVAIASSIIEELLAACPNLKVLVTSRAVLHLQAEHEFIVSPLAVPEFNPPQDPEVLIQCASVNLFVQRAKSILPAFSITKSNARAIAEICVHLEGLPLAIELAAARIKLLPPRALLARLSERLKILKSELRTLPARQQTMYNTIRWSYELLDAQEKWLFRHLAIFVGGCSLEAAETVFGKRGEETIDVLNILDSLLNKSLLQQIEQEGAEPHLIMLETVREYGLECLHTTGELEECQHAHAMYYLAFVEKAGSYLKGALQLEWLMHLERELENLRAALDWLVQQQETEQALRFCEAFGKFCGLRGYWNEERRWLKAVLELPESPERTSVRARVLRRAGHLAYRLRDLTSARALQEKSVALSRELGDKQNLAGALSGLGWVLYRQNDIASAGLLLKEGLEVARESTDRWTLANSLESVGRFMHYQGDTHDADTLLEESVALLRQLEDKESLARILTTLVAVEISQSHVSQAAVLAQESFAIAQELGTKPLIALAFDSLGYVAMLQGQYEQAAIIFEERIKLAQELGDEPTVAIKQLQLGDIALIQGNLIQAMTLIRESLVFFRKQNDNPNVAAALSILGDIKRVQGELVMSMAHYKEALLMDKKGGDKRVLGRCLIGLAQLALDQGRFEQAATLFGVAESWLKPSLDMHPAQRMNYDCALEKLRTKLGELIFVTEWSKGSMMTPEKAINAGFLLDTVSEEC